jgi:retron-type reverse transcriptase
LAEAYRLINKRSAAGIDRITATEYAANLEENLQTLHERLRSGHYKAPPVERMWLEKEDRTYAEKGSP